MNTDELNRIKRLVIIAVFSDDALLECAALKGGNAIDLIHSAAQRGSIDLDFSLETDFPHGDLASTKEHLEQALSKTLGAEGYQVFDVQLTPAPPRLTDDMRDFWGGYRLEFKVIAADRYAAVQGDRKKRGMAAISFGPGDRKRFLVDFSRHEYCAPREARTLDGYRIYVYTPAMLVCEKLRAICQQMTEYRALVRSTSQSPRAKDFFDIHTLVEHYQLDLSSAECQEILDRMFAAKRVPLGLLSRVVNQREFHRPGFDVVADTVKPGVELRGFDFYFDYVVRLLEKLHTGRVE